MQCSVFIAETWNISGGSSPVTRNDICAIARTRHRPSKNTHVSCKRSCPKVAWGEQEQMTPSFLCPGQQPDTAHINTAGSRVSSKQSHSATMDSQELLTARQTPASPWWDGAVIRSKGSCCFCYLLVNLTGRRMALSGLSADSVGAPTDCVVPGQPESPGQGPHRPAETADTQHPVLLEWPALSCTKAQSVSPKRVFRKCVCVREREGESVGWS